jgi:hypothetical protein
MWHHFNERRGSDQVGISHAERYNASRWPRPRDRDCRFGRSCILPPSGLNESFGPERGPGDARGCSACREARPRQPLILLQCDAQRWSAETGERGDASARASCWVIHDLADWGWQRTRHGPKAPASVRRDSPGLSYGRKGDRAGVVNRNGPAQRPHSTAFSVLPSARRRGSLEVSSVAVRLVCACQISPVRYA